MPLVKIFGLTGGKSIPLVPLQKAICDIFNNTPAQTKVIKTRVDGWTEEVGLARGGGAGMAWE